MTVVTELELPEIDYNMPGFGPDTYHQLLGEARQRNWLAHSPLAYIVLDAESGDFFLRARQTTFPGRQLAELFGITSGPLHGCVENNILNLTGDKHRRLRSLIGHAFTPKAADRWRPAMREYLARLWDDLGPGASEDTEFVAAIAKPYPSRTIAAVLGAPVADAGRLQHWSSMVQRQFDIAALSTQSQLSQALRLFAEQPDQWALVSANPAAFVQPGGRGQRHLRHHRRARRQALHVRRRRALLPRRQPGPGRARGGPHLPRPAHARPRAGGRAGTRRHRGHLQRRVAPAPLVRLERRHTARLPGYKQTTGLTAPSRSWRTSLYIVVRQCTFNL